MRNIWFVRMDKQDHNSEFFEGGQSFIFSDHGTCLPKGAESNERLIGIRDKIFPNLMMSHRGVTELVQSIKAEYYVNTEKQRCALAVIYWISIMKESDVVVLRAKHDKVYLCEITDYIDEDVFNEEKRFARPVKVIKQLDSYTTSELIWNRTLGRKTVERNANSNIRRLTFEFLGEIDSVSLSESRAN